jgi:hypothetical protein
VSASTNEGDFSEGRTSEGGTTNNGWVQNGTHTQARDIVQGVQLKGRETSCPRLGKFDVLDQDGPCQQGHFELFSRGASWSHANPCPTACPRVLNIL